MSVNIKCGYCEKPFSHGGQSSKFCSSDCQNRYYEVNIAADAENVEWSEEYRSKSVKSGKRESGMKYTAARDALIDSWIQRYASLDEDRDSQK